MEMSKVLYQQTILEHNHSPHHFGTLEIYSDLQVGNNASCGDKLALYVLIENDIIQNIGFTGEGCAIFKSSASMMTDAVIGKAREDALTLIEYFQQMLLDKSYSSPEEKLGKLALFQGIAGYPARIKCAILPYRTLESILLQKKQEFISTENLTP